MIYKVVILVKSSYLQAMAKTSAWREVLESALKHTKTSPETGPAGNNSCGEGSLGAFSTLIQQALEVCCQF